MLLITRKTLAASAALRWEVQYREYIGDKKIGFQSKEVVRDRLKELGKSPDPDQVDNTIGNTSWTRVPRCSECRGDAPAVVVFSDGYGSTLHLCGRCLTHATDLLLIEK